MLGGDEPKFIVQDAMPLSASSYYSAAADKPTDGHRDDTSANPNGGAAAATSVEAFLLHRARGALVDDAGDGVDAPTRALLRRLPRTPCLHVLALTPAYLVMLLEVNPPPRRHDDMSRTLF